ncbi:hypothetical protein [Amycolatopsis sp. NPDC006125]|uniref:hypothetical protein n=1 Tax=Amycolatopsis sp. NPDC006125 TaxID=3156730 RepID=UPI0033B39442
MTTHNEHREELVELLEDAVYDIDPNDGDNLLARNPLVAADAILNAGWRKQGVAHPDEVTAEVAEMLRADYDTEHDASHLHWQDFEPQARKIVAAVKRHLAGQGAADDNTTAPQPGDRVRLTYGDGSGREGTWELIDGKPALRLDDGTLHEHVTGQVRRDIVWRAQGQDDDTTRLREHIERLEAVRDELAVQRDERQARIDAVLEVCRQGEWQATRWEQPFPVPAWVTDVRAAATQVSQPQPTEDTCRAYEVDGEPVRVHGGGPMSAEEQEALAEVVRAAKRRLEAEVSRPQPEPARPADVPRDLNESGSGKGWDNAIDWLLNSRYMDPEALEHFWHMCDERTAECEWCTEELRDTVHERAEVSRPQEGPQQ